MNWNDSSHECEILICVKITIQFTLHTKVTLHTQIEHRCFYTTPVLIVGAQDGGFPSMEFATHKISGSYITSLKRRHFIEYQEQVYVYIAKYQKIP